ncbi:MAG TPA: hypothetical protein VGN60_01240 [Devosia sp.]|nr:hypothetical protein [Devosia sp.]
MLLTLWSSAAHAACPPAVAADTAAQIRANSERLVCMQNELVEAARQRALELELRNLRASLEALELENRLSRLKQVPVYVPPDL